MSTPLGIELSEREVIICLIGKEIATISRRVAAEREAPGHDADRSDDIIKGGREDVKSLRQIRQELETIFFGGVE